MTNDTSSDTATDGGTGTDATVTAASTTIPVGSIVAMLRDGSNPPPGWLYCDGSAIDPDTYPTLSDMLQDNELPDLRNRSLFGSGSNLGYQTSGGNSEVSLELENIPPHQHYGWGEVDGDNGLGFGQSNSNSYKGSGDTDGKNPLYGSTWAGGTGAGDIAVRYTVDGKEHSDTTWSKPATSTTAVKIMPPYYVANYFIYSGVGG